MQGILYIIKEEKTNYYKIGITTKTVYKRLQELQTGNPRVLKHIAYFNVSNARKTEKLIHSILAKYHVHLEWFELPDFEVLGLIQYVENMPL